MDMWLALLTRTDLPCWSKIWLPWWVGCGTSHWGRWRDRGPRGKQATEEGMQVVELGHLRCSIGLLVAFWNLFKETTTNGPYYDDTIRATAMTNAYIRGTIYTRSYKTLFLCSVTILKFSIFKKLLRHDMGFITVKVLCQSEIGHANLKTTMSRPCPMLKIYLLRRGFEAGSHLSVIVFWNYFFAGFIEYSN